MKAKSPVSVVPIEVAREVAIVLWPRFLEEDGLVFVDITGRRRRRIKLVSWLRDHGHDNTAIEAFENHTHVLDLFKHDPKVWQARSSQYDSGHPHFRLAVRLGVLIAETWAVKLRHDFPEQHFRVYYTRDDDPTVRFHRLYADELPWIEDTAAAGRSKNSIQIWDTRRMG